MPIYISQEKGHLLKAKYEEFEILSGKVTKDSPYEAIPYGMYMVAGLGLCTTVTAIWRVEELGYKAEEVEAVVNYQPDETETYVTDFDIDISMKTDMPKKSINDIVSAAKNCFAQITIRNQPTMNVSLKIKE
jgi:uncharacterized OsmC-like protein